MIEKLADLSGLTCAGLICGSYPKVVVRKAWGVLSHRSNSLA